MLDSPARWRGDGMKQYALLLAGGGGKRLWPLSRENTPKQFITLPTGKTLLETTLDRIAPLTQLDKLIVTTQQYASLTQKTTENYKVRYLIEPERRNTAPAIAWSLRELRATTNDAIVVIMPTDHIITDSIAFTKALVYAIHYVENHHVLLLFGSPQKYISTQFGFISHSHTGTISSHAFTIYPIEKFHEKPSYTDATEYKKHTNIVWNMGIFVGRLSVLWQLFKDYAPNIIDNLDNYQAIIPQAFDHAILERANQHLVLLTHDFGWSDIGCLDTFIPALHNDKKKYIELAGAHNNSVACHKSVILAGVSDLVIIEMNDMILIAQRNLAESPETITQLIRHHGWENLL
jgi:mannose-1-phosphate guanylyltransferase